MSSVERSLTSTDQVDFVDWLVSRSGISAIRLGPLAAHPEQAAGDAFMLVQTLDLALIGLPLLYRSRRVSADLYLQILGGFVRPAMTTLKSAPITLDPGRASVYLVRRRDRKRFKLGWARRPLQRVRHLPEYRLGELDLGASCAIWLPGRPRAEQIERSLRKTLAPYSVPAAHEGAGCSEWFEDVAHDTARRLLAQMPVDEHTRRPARVVPLALLAPPAGAVSIETGPQDTWCVEDLLLRLAMHCPVTVHAPPAVRVVMHGLWRRIDGPLGQLRQAALDIDTYQCEHDGRWLSFVQTIDRDADDVVLQFAPLTLIERWPQGADLMWQVGGFLTQLRRMVRAPMST